MKILYLFLLLTFIFMPMVILAQGTIPYTSDPRISNSMQWDGAYSSGTSYPLYAVVSSGGITYISLVSSNIGHTPVSSPSQWGVLGGGGSTTLPNSLTPVCTDGSGNPETCGSGTINVSKLVGTIDPSLLPSGIPSSEVKFVLSAVCNGGVSFSSGLSTYDNQQPVLACDAPATSTVGHMAFSPAPVAAQYAQVTFSSPPHWTGTDLNIVYDGDTNSGTVGWIIETGCTNLDAIPSTVSFGSPITISSTVSSSVGGLVTTTLQANVAVPGTNGCVAGTSAPGSLVTYRIHRVLTGDTMSGNANLLGIILTTRRSQ